MCVVIETFNKEASNTCQAQAKCIPQEVNAEARAGHTYGVGDNFRTRNAGPASLANSANHEPKPVSIRLPASSTKAKSRGSDGKPSARRAKR